MQVAELAQASQQRAAEAAAARAAAAAEVSAQELLRALTAADAAAQEKLRDLLGCIDDVAAQVGGNVSEGPHVFSNLDCMLRALHQAVGK